MSQTRILDDLHIKKGGNVPTNPQVGFGKTEPPHFSWHRPPGMSSRFSFSGADGSLPIAAPIHRHRSGVLPSSMLLTYSSWYVCPVLVSNRRLFRGPHGIL